MVESWTLTSIGPKYIAVYDYSMISLGMNCSVSKELFADLARNDSLRLRLT